MKKREEANEESRAARVKDIEERIRGAISGGIFDIEADMDYIQSEIIEEAGYSIDLIGKSKRPDCQRYIISWK